VRGRSASSQPRPTAGMNFQVPHEADFIAGEGRARFTPPKFELNPGSE